MEIGIKNTLGNKMKSRFKRISGLLLIGFIGISGSINAQIAGYDYYKPLVITSGQVQGTNANFPVLISYTDTDLIGKTQADGDDIVFATSATSTTILNHELESFNSTTGAITAWVQVPTVSTAGETIFMFYGNNAAIDQSTSSVWDSNYQLVMHMDDLTNASQVSQAITDNGTSAATGQIGGGRDFERDQSDFVTIADNSSLDITGQITISFWYRQESTASPDFVTKGQNASYEATSRNGVRIRFNKNGSNGPTAPNGTNLPTNQWAYLTFVQTSTGRIVYQNATSVASDGNTTAFATNNDALQISRSNDAVDGIMDEVRISNIARSANWIATEYNNQLNPGTFIIPGTEVSLDVVAPVLSIATVDESTLVLDYNENLNSGSSPSTSDFVVRVNSVIRAVSNVSIATDKVTLTLSSAVLINETIEIDYTAGTNPIEDANGNNAVNLSNQAVTNNTLDTAAPGAPVNVLATAIVGGDITISFDDVDEAGSGVASYSVKRSTTSGSGYAQIGTITDNENSSYLFTDNATVNGTTYYYIVTAIDGSSNESVNSTESSAEAGTVIDIIEPSLSLNSVNEDVLVLDYDEDLDEGSVPSTSDFTLRINSTPVTISGVVVTGDKVTLTFSPDVANGDNVELDYASGSNPIQDLVGNDALNFTALNINNQPAFNSGFGPDPCPIVNGQDVAWACFDGTNNGTSMTAEVGGLVIATVTASTANTTFAPNALQAWASGAFSGDQFNGPQINPTGASENATSFDISIPSTVPSDGLVLSLNKLRPDGGSISYTIEAFDGLNSRVPINGWVTGQGTDGGLCTNSITVTYANANETMQLTPAVSGLPACASSSNPIWFRIDDEGIERIEIRKVSALADNIFLGLGLVADFGDAPATYSTSYSSRSEPPAFHILNNTDPNTVFLGTVVDGDGNGASNSTSTGDDIESSGIDNGDDEDGISVLANLNTAQTSYTTTLSCTDGGNVSGWVDLDQSGTFDVGEFDSGVCFGGTVTLNWNGITGLVTGTTHARFRIGSVASEVANPTGAATDGEVEDYTLDIIEPNVPDLELSKSVDNSNPVEGDNVSFTVKVKNLGPDDATEIVVTDQLPAGLTFIGYVAGQGTYVDGTGIWDVGTVAFEDSVSLVIQASVNASTLGQTITNNATISSLKETDPNLSNNAASAGVTVVPEASDIAVTITVDDNTVLEGQFVEYEIIVQNNGPKNATSLNILNQLPSGITFQSSTVTSGTYTNGTGVWNIGNLANGIRDTLTVSVQVDANTEGNQITNSVDVTSLDQNDANATNNTAAVSIDVITASFPTNCNEVSVLSFTGSTLQSGTAGQVGAIYRFNSVISGVYAEFEILTVNNAILTNFDQNSSGVNGNFQPQVEASDKTLDNAYIDFEISFYDDITNNPRYLTFATSAVDVDGDNSSTREFVGFQRLTSFTVESSTNLAAGSEGLFSTFESATTLQINGIDPNDTGNLAYTSYTNEPKFRLRAGIKDPTQTTGVVTQRLFSFNFDPCLINNFSNPVSSDIVDISVTKSVDFNTPSVGNTVTYTITAKNEQGNSVSNIDVTDQLPGGLNLSSASATKGTYTSGTGIWDIGSLTGQESATLTIEATVNGGQAGNTITNTATLTDFTGTDGNTSNNSAFVDIIVFDPSSGLTCNEPPLFSFVNPNLEQGVPLSINAIYRFSNIASGVDALVKVLDINNATLDNIDNDGIANSSANFSPFFTALGGGGYIDWEIMIVQTGTNTPIKRSFALTGLDIDGENNGSGGTLTDYLGFAQNRSSTVEGGTNLTVGTSGVFQTFESSVTTDGVGTFDLDHMAYIVYNYTSVFEIRTGSNTSAGYSDDRLVDIDFTQCRNQDFANPVTTTRNADISVVKTADESNPLENETVNFTITVTNNGPEDATELDINETLPAGLTLVQATPSTGAYNQLTKLWSIGTLANGVSASLALETTVHSGLSQDSLINRAYVNGLNQFDPTVANDTSEVVIYLSVEISGTVFEDIKGDGYTEDTNFGDASGDQQALENVEVHLFKDGGDGVADGVDDEYLRSTTTNNAGLYTFNIGEDADYWIVVDSKTGDLSNGTTWGEQTYAAAGALCEDGTNTTTSTVTLGHCFGGRRGGVSDNISDTPVTSDLANAEHVIKRTVANSGITGIDFGFSFNVVTRMNDNDSDLGTNRHSQGTLRQFIQNANEITGANTMRFIPTVPTTNSGSTGAWWKYELLSELPVITDALTTIDGTAFLLTAPKTSRNDNAGSVGSGSTVGIDNVSLNAFTNKEFEIDLSNLGSNAFVVNTAGAFVIRQIAMYNNDTGSGIKVQNASSGLIENNLIGPRASGVDQGSGSRLGNGILFEGGSSTSTLIQNNYIAYLDGSGIESSVTNASVDVFKNEIYRTGLVDTQSDGIEGLGTWTITQNLIHEIGNSGSLDLDGGSGIELGGNTGGSSGSTIRNNTIKNNALTGITALNSVTSTLIEKNIINGNGTNYNSTSPRKGAGIKLTTPNSLTQQGIRITRNSFYANKGVSIDVVTGGNGEADGVSPNDGALQSATTSPNRGLDYPVFTLSTLNGNILHVEGYVGTTGTKLTGPFTIEVYKAEDDGDNDGLIELGGALTVAHGEGRDFLGSFTTNTDGTFNTDITLSGSPTVVFNDRITAIAISSVSNTSEFSGNQRVVPTGVSISGTVYNDSNHNMLFDGTESGIQGVTMVLYNVAQNNCKSVLTAADGSYSFTNVLNGTYNLIESFGQSVPTPDICTPAEVDPTNFISTTPNLRTVTVNNLPAIQNFGDFEGVKIQGTVFDDNGLTSGTPNNGIKDGGEIGFTNQLMKVVTSTDVLIEQTSISADGMYSLYVPVSAVSDGGTVKVVEVNAIDKISTGGSAGTTTGSYNINTDETTFPIAYGTIYTGVDFADVSVSRLLTNGERTVQPGAVVLFQHLFEAKTGGDVYFSTNSINNPTNPNWPVVLYEDLNCNGEFDSGDPVILPSVAKSVVTGQQVCLLVKVSAPLGLNDGASNSTTLTATFDLDNTSPTIQQVLTRTDLTTVGTAQAGLVIIKSVNKAQALPGDSLTYSIDYENLGDEPITQVEIIDVIPSFTTYQSSNCGTLPSGITNCVITSPAIGSSGTVKWTFTGALNPGDTGIVTFTVKIDD